MYERVNDISTTTKEEEEVHHDLTHHTLHVRSHESSDENDDDDDVHHRPTTKILSPLGGGRRRGSGTFRRLSLYEQVDHHHHEDDACDVHSYHGDGHDFYYNRSFTPSTFDGTTPSASSGEALATAASTTHPHQEENEGTNNERNSQNEHNNVNDLLYVDLDSDTDDNDEDGVQRYAFNFPSSLQQQSAPTPYEDARNRTYSTCSSIDNHDARTPLTLKSSSSIPKHQYPKRHSTPSASSYHPSISSTIESNIDMHPDLHHHHHHHTTPPPSPLIVIATKIRTARLDSKRRRAERILALSDNDVQTPLGLALTHTRLCLLSWCDLMDRGFVLIIVLLVFIVCLYNVLDGERYGKEKHMLVWIGLPVVVVRVCWGPVWWYVWGRRIEKRRQERMELYDGLNGAHGTGGIEIPTMMMNELYSDHANDKYNTSVEGDIEDGFDNECDGMGRYSDHPIVVDHHIKDGIHHNEDHGIDDSVVVVGDEYGGSSDDYETASHEVSISSDESTLDHQHHHQDGSDTDENNSHQEVAVNDGVVDVGPV